MQDYDYQPTPLDEIGLKRVLEWLPQHIRKAEIAYNKAAKNGRYSDTWREAFHYHSKIADMMQANLDVTD